MNKETEIKLRASRDARASHQPFDALVHIAEPLFESHDGFAIGGLAALYLAVGIAAAVMLRKKILTQPGLFPATMAELGKDRDRLKASSCE